MSSGLPPAVLVIIPARGGSKGIPRKNVRSLAGHPLIRYAIRIAQASKFHPDIVVSSDDDEILALADRYGAEPMSRDPDLAQDSSTLDEVVYQTWRTLQADSTRNYDLVATLQPTSPLLKPTSLDRAVDLLLTRPDLDTVISAREDTHLTWRLENDRFVPNYTERLNRQYLPKTYRETGAFVICRSRVLDSGTRIGDNPSLHLLFDEEAIDIDTLEDFNVAEWHLTRRHVVFVVAGHADIGLGHVYNALSVANDLTRHDLTFVVDCQSDLAAEVLASRNFHVVRQSNGGTLLESVTALSPDVVINDRLDTEATYIAGLKKRGIKVINFEDLGDGAAHADLVINAIYPERELRANHYFGQRYFCVRDEFVATAPKVVERDVRRVLITFGGTDPNDLTSKVVNAIQPTCEQRGIEIEVILGMGYVRAHGVPSLPAQVQHNVSNMSDHIRGADIVFTSAGRTVFEVACIGTPAIVLAQNERETTHFFASEEHGFLNLGLGAKVSDADLVRIFEELVDGYPARQHMSRLMLDNELREGKRRVIDLIERTIAES